jgi:hypothetical protein
MYQSRFKVQGKNLDAAFLLKNKCNQLQLVSRFSLLRAAGGFIHYSPPPSEIK